MAKAQFHRGQKVWVETIGTWATVEQIVPVWAKGFDEPIRISYDLGLGREFLAQELREDEIPSTEVEDRWRVMRARNKWQAAEDCAHHPNPGTFPVVVTDPSDWGGWRTPGAEYDRDPRKIERQARLISVAPRLLAIARDMVTLARDPALSEFEALRNLANRALAVERQLHEIPERPASSRIAEEP